MDHWALLMMKDPEEPHLLQATSLQYQLAHAPRSFSGEVHALQTTGTDLARRTHRPQVPLSLRLGRRSRRTRPVPGLKKRAPHGVLTPGDSMPEILTPRQARMRHRRGPLRGCPGRCPSERHLPEPPRSPRVLRGCGLPSPLRGPYGAYGAHPLGGPREVPADRAQQGQECHQRHQPGPYGPPPSGLAKEGTGARATLGVRGCR
jgi:hypothetical protein